MNLMQELLLTQRTSFWLGLFILQFYTITANSVDNCSLNCRIIVIKICQVRVFNADFCFSNISFFLGLVWLSFIFTLSVIIEFFFITYSLDASSLFLHYRSFVFQLLSSSVNAVLCLEVKCWIAKLPPVWIQFKPCMDQSESQLNFCFYFGWVFLRSCEK